VPSKLGRKELQGREQGHPRVFVSVASKGFSLAVSLLFAALAGRPISVASKEFRGAKS
jgi:hypothetical protein